MLVKMHACAVSVYQALSKEPGYEAMNMCFATVSALSGSILKYKGALGTKDVDIMYCQH